MKVNSENVISFFVIASTLSCFGYALYCYEISRNEEIAKREKEKQNSVWNYKENEQTQYIKKEAVKKEIDKVSKEKEDENIGAYEEKEDENIDVPEVIESKQKDIPEYFNAKEYKKSDEAEMEYKKPMEAKKEENLTSTINTRHDIEENKNDGEKKIEEFRKLLAAEENRILEMEETEKKRKKFERERINKAEINESKRNSIVYHSIAARKLEEERHAKETKRIKQMYERETKRKENKELEIAEARQCLWKMKEKLDNGESILELLERRPKQKVYPDLPQFTKKEENQIPEEYQKLIQKRITLKLYPSANSQLTIKRCLLQISKSCGLPCKEENLNITDDMTVPSFIVKNKKAIECIELICNANGFKYFISKDGLEIK